MISVGLVRYIVRMGKRSIKIGSRGGISSRAFSRLLAFRSDVLSEFPAQIESLLLFGSRVRGSAKHDSDYDVAVVLKGNAASTAIDRRLSAIAYPYIVQGTHISAISVNAGDVRAGSAYPLGTALTREGVELV